MSLPSRLLGANPSIQVSTLLSGSLSTPSAKQAFVPAPFESIATVEVPSSPTQSEINFTSIPATYKHLHLRGIVRDARAVTLNTMNLRVGNGSIDTGNNYSTFYLDGDGSVVNTSQATSYSSMAYMIMPGASAGSSIFGGFVMDILDYADTDKFKAVRFLGGSDINGSGQIGITNALWMSKLAITHLRFFDNANPNFAQYTHIALYGIRG